MAKQSRKSEKNNMSSNEALAALGLEDEAVNTVADTETAAEPVAEAADAAEREEVDVGEIELGTLDYIPSSQRTSGGSKYKFGSLAAPAAGADGKTKYSFFKVTLHAGVEADKLKRSIQSATTQANKQGKEAGKYYITRTQNDAEGNFAGMLVIRTDDRPASGEEEAAS